MNNHSRHEPVLAALFVDFDNIYISLEQQGKEIADQFAVNPDRWLSWLERAIPGNAERRILVRRCYLNPQAFADWRPYFIRSAFEVVDCPPLTGRGKTSTDIHLVVDALDILNHSTHFSEFIIFSGDADFTPLLLRLRMHNRRTVVVTAGYVSPAYKSSCDHLITPEEFIRDGLGIGDTEEEQEPAAPVPVNMRASRTLLERMAERIYEVAVPPQGIVANELPKIYTEFNEFKQGENWLGYRSLRKLTEAIVEARSDLLALTGDDPWRVTRLHENQDDTAGDVRRTIATWIQSIVSESPKPVTMASLAGGVTEHFGPEIRNSDWLGAETFKGLLNQLDLGELRLLSTIPGYVYDPRRHGPQGTLQDSDQPEATGLQAAPAGDFSVKHPELAPLAWKINQLTETPYLLPEDYAVMFEEIAREINENGNYQWTRTSKTVRDRCVEKGIRISRAQVNFILTGLYYSGYLLGREIPVDTSRLAAKLMENTIALCRNAQFRLSESDVKLIQMWIAPGDHHDGHPVLAQSPEG